MDWLNYNHLYYFWVIAREGGITRAAERLRLTQSTLSSQLKQLEDSLGHQLFDRKNRQLQLTESGRIAFEYAGSIFSTGQELFDLFKHRSNENRPQVIRIGSISSLSKNLQFEFIRPVIDNRKAKIIFVEGLLSELVRQLHNHQLDVVISNLPVAAERGKQIYNHELGAEPVSVVAAPKFLALRADFPASLKEIPIYLPTAGSKIRADFELMMEQARVKADIQAEVEDMALLRLFAINGTGLAIVPEIVVKNELANKQLIVIKSLANAAETFYAITLSRKIPNPLIEMLIKEFQSHHRPKKRVTKKL